METEVESECVPPVLKSMVEFKEIKGNVLSLHEVEVVGA